MNDYIWEEWEIEELVEKLKKEYLNKTVKFGDIDVDVAVDLGDSTISYLEAIESRGVSFDLGYNDGNNRDWINFTFELIDEKTDEELEDLYENNNEFVADDILINMKVKVTNVDWGKY
ncbi:hypothetical protein [Clostridium sp. ZBS18]|uniref:hypothetical protein n=1 Tax=Clostridium sp. ZBS18 TaxID=2949967 RepID=UPI00207A2553|nr:hypothetical protein [Clostridium sp. ZBS18]